LHPVAEAVIAAVSETYRIGNGGVPGAAEAAKRRMLAAFAEKDANGRDLAPLWAMFSDDELRAAERMARAENMSIHLLHRDPTGRGWRYLRLAQLALRSRDPGAIYRDPTPQPRRSATDRRAMRVAPRA
jgi:hypothetical protein